MSHAACMAIVDVRSQALYRCAIVAQVAPTSATKLMSKRLAPFVHGCATLLLKEGFVANTQDHTSHSLGPNGPIEALDESVRLTELVRYRALTPRERERESTRLSEGTKSP